VRGKTSLLNLLVGFEKADAGTITGTARVAWVPQNGGLWPHCSAREHLEIACRSGEGIEQLLAMFDLAERACAFPEELSEGEQSRLAVARALACGGEVLVMDEPLVHVDPARVGKYWEAIREHVARANVSLVFSTHEPEAAMGEAQHVICLRDGRVLHAGRVAELYANPPTQELMECLGAGNWFTPEESAHWLGADARCIRPERLAIEPAQDGAIIVESSRFKGSIAEAVLRDERTGNRGYFFTGPLRTHLLAGCA
jgi:ABC-type multidrug transport system ATPase subunit